MSYSGRCDHGQLPADCKSCWQDTIAAKDAEIARLREALNHIKDMQTVGYIVLGEEATGKMTAALAGEPKDLGPMHPGLPSEKVEVAR